MHASRFKVNKINIKINKNNILRGDLQSPEGDFQEGPLENKIKT